MNFKKVFTLTVFVSMVVSCSGVQLDGDYELKRTVPVGTMALGGAVLGAVAGMYALNLEKGHFDVREAEALRSESRVQSINNLNASSSEKNAKKWSSIRKNDFYRECCRIMLGGPIVGAIGGLMASFGIWAVGDSSLEFTLFFDDRDRLMKYEEIRKIVGDIATSLVVIVSKEEFPDFVKNHCSDKTISTEIDELIKKLEEASVKLVALIESTKKEKEKWYEELRVIGNRLLNGIALVLADLENKRAILQTMDGR
jgi:hypothetical protein